MFKFKNKNKNKIIIQFKIIIRLKLLNCKKKLNKCKVKWKNRWSNIKDKDKIWILVWII